MKYAAKVTSVREQTLRVWLGSGLFETEHFAKNTKTNEKTFYFAPNDQADWRNSPHERFGRLESISRQTNHRMAGSKRVCDPSDSQ
jgi:hypothetical protein